VAGRVDEVEPVALPKSNDIAEAETEMPRSCSIFMKSERVRRASPLARTCPAIWIAPP
jgi:hypothetical protein